MPPRTVCFTLSLYILSTLESIQCYSYQTEPLFLSFSELAALEENSSDETSRFGNQVKAFALSCHEDSIEVVIKVPQFDPSLPLEPGLWRLGSVGAGQHPCTAKVSGDGQYTIRAPLGDCGSNVTFTQSSLLYNNLLLLQHWPPRTTPGDVLQAEGAAIPVQCEYPRRYTVSSGALKPTWSPMFPIRSTHLDLDFRLRLMTEDWSSERSSSVYFLGETVNIEASVDPPPLPLRLYVDDCVATLTSDVQSYPSYPFIDQQGCFIDSQLHGSSSCFLSRVQDRLLHFQLEPFLFHQDPRHTMYITCHLEAVLISNKKPVKRACSFVSGRWRSVDGDDHLCESCSSTSKSPHKRELRSKINHRREELHRETRLRPIIFLP